MTILPFGDRAVLINFNQLINIEINTQVVALSNAIESHRIPGVTFCIPAYCSITIGYHPDNISFKLLEAKIMAIYSSIADGTTNSTSNSTINNASRRINIPVCYHQDFAVDKNEIIRQTHLNWQEIVDLHTSIEYRVYMLGFIAGFAYLGTLPEALKCSRKSTPRINIPAGTVGIAGLQTGIYPKKAHAGWQLMGRTPIRVFEANAKNPFLFRSGDLVQFSAIDPDQYKSISYVIDSGNFNIKSVISDE
jgi:KipI family sensor histidine kinase inhibitor